MCEYNDLISMTSRVPTVTLVLTVIARPQGGKKAAGAYCFLLLNQHIHKTWVFGYFQYTIGYFVGIQFEKLHYTCTLTRLASYTLKPVT